MEFRKRRESADINTETEPFQEELSACSTCSIGHYVLLCLSCSLKESHFAFTVVVRSHGPTTIALDNPKERSGILGRDVKPTPLQHEWSRGTEQETIYQRAMYEEKKNFADLTVLNTSIEVSNESEPFP